VAPAEGPRGTPYEGGTSLGSLGCYTAAWMGTPVHPLRRGLVLSGILVIALAAVAPPTVLAASLAPDFTIRLSDRANFTLSQHRDKVVVLDFMYLGCPSCKLAETALKSVYWKYRNDTATAGQYETVSIGILPEYIDTLEEFASYKQSRGLPWPMGPAGAAEGNAVQLYGVSEVVHLFVINKEGYVTWSYVARVGLDPCALTRDLDAAVAAAFSGQAQTIEVGNAGVFALIAVAALASFLSPCSFPLLPGYMTHYLTRHAQRGGTKAQGALGGFAAGLGIIVVYGVIGLIVVAAGAAAAAVVPILQPIVGGVLIALGLLTLTSRQFYFLSEAVEKLRARLFGDKEQSERFYLSLFSYGAGYGAAGFGCVAAPFIAAVLFATAMGGAAMGALAFLVYAVIVIALMVALTVALSVVGETAVKKLNKYTEVIKKISAVVLILAGIYLIYFFWSTTTAVSCEGQPFPWWIVFLVIGVFAAAVAAYYLLRRRRMKAETATPPATPPPGES